MSFTPTTTPTPPLLADPVQRLLSLLQERRARGQDQRVVVGLVGLPGSGKSTRAAQWQVQVNETLHEHTMQSVGMDGFHLSRQQLSELPNPQEALERRGAPWTFAPQALAAGLHRIKAAPRQAVSWPGFEHAVGDPVEAALQIAPETELVLVEGLYLLHEMDGWNVHALLDECWFLDTPPELALERLQARHMAAWGISAEAARARIVRSDRLNAELVQSHRPRADWLVSEATPNADALALH